MSEDTAQVEAQSTPAGTDNALVESPPTGEQQTETKPERPSRARDRIQALASDKRAAVEYAEFQKQRADELEKKLQAQHPAEDNTPPDISKYDDATKWATDYSNWATKMASKVADDRIAERIETMETERTQAQIENDFEASLNDAAQKHDDFWEVITDPSATHMNGALLDALKQMPDAGELAYHLNSNPLEARQIAAKSPVQIAAELGRLSVTLAGQTKAPDPNLTKAPEPPTDLTGAAKGEVDLNKVGIDDYMRIRREQLKARRGY